MPESGTRGLGGTVRISFVSDAMLERNGVGAYYADLISQFGSGR